eukprot:2296045-Pyramimonas_sp.AAC.2
MNVFIRALNDATSAESHSLYSGILALTKAVPHTVNFSRRKPGQEHWPAIKAGHYAIHVILEGCLDNTDPMGAQEVSHWLWYEPLIGELVMNRCMSTRWLDTYIR